MYGTGHSQIPSLPKIQRLIEGAWQKGFDPQGAEQLGSHVVGTSKWIGATEIVATLSALKVKSVCRVQAVCIGDDHYIYAFLTVAV